VVKREARLTALAMTTDGSSLAVGDDAGKIFHLANLGDLAKRNFVI